MSGLAITELVPERYILDSRRCKLITNHKTGLEYARKEKDPDAWSLLYFRAAKHPEEFLVEFDKPISKAEEINKRYTADELSRLAMPRLREIGLIFGVTSNSKLELAKKILSAQDTPLGE